MKTKESNGTQLLTLTLRGEPNKGCHQSAHFLAWKSLQHNHHKNTVVPIKIKTYSFKIMPGNAPHFFLHT